MAHRDWTWRHGKAIRNTKAKRKPWHSTPSWCGVLQNRQYRAECQNLMQREQYDDLIRPRRNERWNYW